MPSLIPLTRRLTEVSPNSWGKKLENLFLMKKLQNHFCIGYILQQAQGSCGTCNGDSQRLWWTKSNINEVLYRLQQEQLRLQQLQLAASPRPATRSVFRWTAGNTIITMTLETKETCYYHTVVSELGLWTCKDGKSIHHNLHWPKKSKKREWNKGSCLIDLPPILELFLSWINTLQSPSFKCGSCSLWCTDF